MGPNPGADFWLRLEAAFEQASALPPPARAAFLDRACGEDAALRDELDAMLAADVPERALEIERLVYDGASSTLDSERDPLVGMRLGAWRLIGAIGRGGMGTVYLAERADGQYEQQVAVKVVRGAAQSLPAASRFKAEAYILALLSHPNIARLLDAGLTPEGSPYLVMEHVDGSPITVHCDSRRLTIAERLQLFRVVCDATQHAHQALVVHRDLKPSNIFVSRSGEVKLLDFGIAKLLEPEPALDHHTAPDLRALTPEYAAPEQIRGEPVTTAADVYVLGAVLYELLTGERPARVRAGGDARFDAAPVAPSVIVDRHRTHSQAGEAAGLSERVAARRTTAARLVRHLSGDIDRVVIKALQPLPDRRYGTAGQLGDEIGRLLTGRPVQAQSDTMAYRARRFAGRHRVGVAMAAALGAILLAFGIVASMQARAVRLERDRAQQEARRAQRVAELVTGIFAIAEPSAGRGDTITARELLDQASRRIDLELGGDPETQAVLYNALARVYGNLALHDPEIVVLRRAQGLEAGAGMGETLLGAETLHLLGEHHASRNEHAAAEADYRHALVLRRGLNAPSLHVAATLDGLARVLGLADRFDEARALLEESVAIRRQEPGPARVELVSGLYELGMLLHRTGEIERARQLWREALALGGQISEPSPAKVTTLLVLAEVVADVEGEPAKAESLLREALSLARTMYVGDHHQLAICQFELARRLASLDRLPEAEALARESAAMMRRLHGGRNDQTLLAVRILAAVLVKQQRMSEAEVVLRSALADERAVFGEGHPSALATARSLASAIEAQGRYDEARALREDDLAHAIAVLGEDDVFVAIGLSGLGQNGLDSGRPDLAAASFRRALKVRQRIHPADHWRIAEARGQVGMALLAGGRLAQAETDLVAAYEGLRAQRGTGAAETERVRLALLDLYERSNRPEDARRYSGDDR